MYTIHKHTLVFWLVAWRSW